MNNNKRVTLVASIVRTGVKFALSTALSNTFRAVTTVTVAFALTFPALSQRAYGQVSTRTREAAQRVPGERVTFQQRQALMHLGAGTNIEFNDHEVPSSISGLALPRTRPGDPQGEAESVLASHADAYRRGLDDGFTFTGIESDKDGGHTVHMAQTYRGIPVIGAGLNVRVSADAVTGISGRFIPDLQLDTVPAIAEADVAAKVLALTREEGAQNAQRLRVSGPAVFVDKGHPARLVFTAELAQGEGDGSTQEAVFVDARNGQVLARTGASTMETVPPGCSTGLICTSTQLLTNPDFESGRNGSWTETSTIGARVVDQYGPSMCFNNSGWCAWFDGWGSTDTDRLYQMVTIPSNITSATLSFHLKIWTQEGYQYPYDTLAVQIRPPVLNTSGYFPGPTPLQQLATYSNVSAYSLPFSYGNFVRQAFDVTKFKGQTIFVYFEGKEDYSKLTSFVIDNVILTVQ
jgi:Fungalysin/Thermolysin Propeptide Motif